MLIFKFIALDKNSGKLKVNRFKIPNIRDKSLTPRKDRAMNKNIVKLRMKSHRTNSTFGFCEYAKPTRKNQDSYFFCHLYSQS